MGAFTGNEITLETKNLVLHGKQWGRRGGRPVLALHGWLDNAASFDHLAPLLKDVNLIALDLPGHGYSNHYPPGFHYHLIDLVQAVFDASIALKWSHFTLLGHSLGGIIGSLLAASFPESVDALVLIDSLGPVTEDVSQAPTRMGKAIRAILAPPKESRNIYPDLNAAITMRQQSGDLTYEAASVLTQRGTGKVTEGLVWRFDPKLLTPSIFYFTESQARAFLSAIEAPTLCIEAKKGLLVRANKKLLKERKACVSKLKHVSLTGGHHLHLEEPQSVAEVINQFLEEYGPNIP